MASAQFCLLQDDARHMKEVMPPGIRLLGFKPKADLKVEHYVHPASFIYPDEKTVKGIKMGFPMKQVC